MQVRSVFRWSVLGAVRRLATGRRAAALAAALLAALVHPATADPAAGAALEVEARNLTVPERCAEKDNVQIDFVSPLVRAMRIQAIHPAYIGTIGVDRWAADLTACDFHPDAQSFAEHGQRVTLWESPMMWLVGFRLKDFWRPATTTVRVGDKIFEGLHIVQLWTLFRERAEEFLVFYPPDGYWRARPYPFGDMRWTAYGTSFLVGPVEVQERPVVDLSDIAFEPATRTFALTFRRGGGARMTVAAIDQEHVALDVAFTGPRPPDLPFAALRSMYATQTNADAARLAWRQADDKGWREADLFGFKTGPVVEMHLGRHVPSRHNTSAPDMIVGRFSR